MKFIEIISIAGYSIEAFGVLVVIVGSCISSVSFIGTFQKLPEGVAYRDFRRKLGRSIILGLEFLIAGDIIRTVVVADTFENVAVLGIIILIRTFLSMTLHLEVEGVVNTNCSEVRSMHTAVSHHRDVSLLWIMVMKMNWIASHDICHPHSNELNSSKTAFTFTNNNCVAT